MQIKWTDLAQDDLDRVEDYIRKTEHASIALAAVLTILDSIELMLPIHPKAGRLGRLEGTRELVVSNVPFIVIYRVAQSNTDALKHELQILRVMHDTQLWPLDS